MATLNIHTDRIIGNIKKLNDFLIPKGYEWTLVTKVMNGYKPALEKILGHPEIKRLHSVGDSRISNLKVIKEIKPDIVTIYIKPPAVGQAKNVVKYADISLNTSLEAIKEINSEADKQGKTHRIIVMLEMGELREGVVRDNILKFYEKIFKMKNIEIIGLGTNLGCMYGVEPTNDKLIQLSLYEQLIETKFGVNLQLLSSGSSITLPLLSSKRLPKGINHFRIGEAAFLGVSPYDNKKFKNLSTNAFTFAADIVELEKKEVVPDGKIGDAAIGETSNFEDLDYNESYRAIVDFGELDVDYNNLSLKDQSINFLGTTSDMTVYDLGEKSGKYKVGDKIHYNPNYMAVARLTNSKYMTKKIL
ncbi:MAG: alanine racemase [Melioribacteraceae bacterium]|nr:alanine racemase [Melioribacteraceae bacterium]